MQASRSQSQRVAMAIAFYALLTALLVLPEVARAGEGPERPAGAKVHAVAPKDAAALPFGEGERIRFSIQVFGKDAGRGEAWVGAPKRERGQEIVPVAARLQSLGFFDNVYPVRDVARSFLAPATGTPVRAEFRFEENRTPARQVSLTFEGRRAGRVKGTREEGKFTFRVADHAPTAVLDPLGTFYHIRTRELSDGESFILHVHNGKRMYKLAVRVVGKEDVWTKKFGVTKAWRIEARAVRADGSRKGWHQDMAFWLSTDARRLPLRMTFDFPLGDVDARIEDVQMAAVPGPGSTEPAPLATVEATP